MKATVTFILVSIALLVMLISVTVKYLQLRKEKTKYKNLYENLKGSMQKIEENIANANAEKEKLNTGNSATNINNAADIMHKYAQSRRK